MSYLDIKFKSNSLQITVNFAPKINQDLALIIDDENNHHHSIYGILNQKTLEYTSWGVANLVLIENNVAIINYISNNIFKYKITLISQINGVLEILEKKVFDIKDHNFTLNLKSENENEIKIWKDYIKLVESILNTKINYLINSERTNVIEISRYYYDCLLKQSENPITEDYSSLTIIKSIFDIL
jgi:hypothetical protein